MNRFILVGPNSSFPRLTRPVASTDPAGSLPLPSCGNCATGFSSGTQPDAVTAGRSPSVASSGSLSTPSKPELCSRCHGRGETFTNYSSDYINPSAKPSWLPCDHCEGTGFEPIPDSDEEFPW